MIESLPVDQKCIMYSLLCYDDNKISWRDRDQWLSTLNDIRKELFGAGLVSVRDTNKVIDELKRMNLVRTNDQCLKIASTNYFEDDMYRIYQNMKFSNLSYIFTVLCVTNITEYYKTWINEKRLYPSAVYRLQMDILIHPKTEDVQDEVSWICKYENTICDSFKNKSWKISFRRKIIGLSFFNLRFQLFHFM